MPELHIENPRVTVDGDDISEHLEEAIIVDWRETRDATAMGTGRRSLPGLKGWAVILITGPTGGELDAMLFDLTGKTCELAIKEWDEPVSEDNPEYRAQAMIRDGQTDSERLVFGPGGSLERVTS